MKYVPAFAIIVTLVAVVSTNICSVTEHCDPVDDRMGCSVHCHENLCKCLVPQGKSCRSGEGCSCKESTAEVICIDAECYCTGISEITLL